ncbi:hypothetical protein IH86_01800 [Sphingobium yanoikuyae]|nr:hypothetical protein IH86_01800 [Sphingobium yanoikuyae]
MHYRRRFASTTILSNLKVHSRLFTPPICFDFVTQALILMQRYDSRALDSRNMDEAVRSAIFGR